MISSRAFPPRVALGVTAVAEFSGPLLFGVAVADTIGNEIVDPSTISLYVVLAALVSAIAWDVLTWMLGFPSSSSHALIGGILGAVTVGAGIDKIKYSGLAKVFLTLFTSPIIGFVAGIIMLKVVLALCHNATPRINNFFKHSQIVTGLALALSHGTNDSQKTMGIITLALVTAGKLKVFAVPLWVIIACASMIALGTSIGGWSLIRTLGGKFYKIRPVDGFTAQLTSATVIIGASLAGGPVSTTQVVSSAIMGIGSADRANKVRWSVAQDIAVAWLLTIPATALLASGVYWILRQVIA
jgi:PiT family inorganic phosphate transporter